MLNQIDRNAEQHAAVVAALQSILKDADGLEFFSATGLPREPALMSEIIEQIVAKLLPQTPLDRDLDSLLSLLFPHPQAGLNAPPNASPNAAPFIAELIRARHMRTGLRALFRRNTALLARKMVEHNAEHGDHYIARQPQAGADQVHRHQPFSPRPHWPVAVLPRRTGDDRQGRLGWHHRDAADARRQRSGLRALVRLKDAGNFLLMGDLAHFHENYESNGVPAFNFHRGDTVASLERVKKIAANLKATVIIQHDPSRHRQAAGVSGGGEVVNLELTTA